VATIAQVDSPITTDSSQSVHIGVIKAVAGGVKHRGSAGASPYQIFCAHVLYT
jgi:hypothetical protein